MSEVINEHAYSGTQTRLSIVHYVDGKATYLNDVMKSVTISGDLATAHRKCEITINNTRFGRERIITPQLGATIRIFAGTNELFSGVLFNSSINSEGEQQLSAYDYAIYLAKNTDSLKFVNKKASDILREICTKFGLKAGTIDDTGYVIPKLILRDKTLYDMILIALTETRKVTGKKYTLQMIKGALHLRECKTQLTRLWIESGRNLLSADYSESMEDRRTQIKLTGGSEDAPSIGTTERDAEAVSKVGLMQHYEHQADITDKAKLREFAKNLLRELNKTEQEFDIEALGISSVWSGTAVLVNDNVTGISGAFYVMSDSHQYDAHGVHTMSLRLSKTLDIPEQEYEAPSESTTTDSNSSITIGTSGSSTTTSTAGKAQVTSNVRKWESSVRKNAKANGIEQYTELLLAIMMQESGGRHADLMQSSASSGKSLTYESSIAQGVKYFAEGLRKAGNDVKIALQAYNFGHGFIDYAKAKGGYSKKVATDFSNAMKKKYGYSRYGDINYVDNVLRYYKQTTVVQTSAPTTAKVTSAGFMRPCTGSITSGFGPRNGRMHHGIDIAQSGTVPIVAAADGTVVKSYVSSSYGETIIIRHNINGKIYETLYAHMRSGSRKYQNGATVKKGATIGYMGNTGESRGQHLHFEIHEGEWNNRKSNAVNPMNFIK